MYKRPSGYTTKYATEIDRVYALPPSEFWIVHESNDYEECKREAELREPYLDPGQTIRVVNTSPQTGGLLWFRTGPRTR